MDNFLVKRVAICRDGGSRYIFLRAKKAALYREIEIFIAIVLLYTHFLYKKVKN